MDFTDTALIRIGARQVDRQFALAPIECAISVIGAGLLLVAGWVLEVSPVAMLLSVVPLIVAMVRWIVAILYGRAPPPSSAITRWGVYFNFGAVISALSWGLAAAYISLNESALAATLAAVVVVIVSSSCVAVYAGAIKITIAFAAFSLAPAAAAAATHLDSTGILVCASLVAAFLSAVLGAVVVKRLVWDAVISTSENEQLTGHLDQRRTQVEKLNIALKTNADKREQAEITLRRTAADLGLVQGKAKALADTLERVSPHCQVTGLSNRRNFDQQFESEWRRAIREKKPVSLVIVEIDAYQEYFDTYGSQSADGLLKKIGQMVKGFGRRSGDLAGRWENEKLAIMLPGCDARNALRVGEALRKRIETTKITHAAAKGRSIVTIHAGVATVKPSAGLPSNEIQKRADAALYEARFQGGNKVIAHQPLSRLKLQRWDKATDGPLSEQSMLQKLLVWGYDTSKDILRSHDKPKEYFAESDSVIAVLAGELMVEVEGHAMVIKGGDSLVVPNGMSITLQAKSDVPVVLFSAIKA
ncbi:MAG: diguanylate cyclase (GGDEF)-like protein [Gammaproteobacteria bacterium]|jgi:diguanylate cyclase (GGDEF)-like protein